MAELTGEQEKLLQAIPEDGSAIGNTTLTRKLGLSEEVYWPLRDALIEKGLIARGRGRGGAVHRILQAGGNAALPSVEEVAKAEAEVFAEEAGLYEPMRSVIQSDWAKEHQIAPLGTIITALQGRRSTGGRWTRPDIVLLAVRTYRYVPGKFLEAITFEVKPHDVFDVSAVYEALAHRRSATRSYVLIHLPKEHANAAGPIVQELIQVARTHDIGVIVAEDPKTYSTWDEIVEAERHEPDPQRLDQFIATQVPVDIQDAIARALR